MADRWTWNFDVYDESDSPTEEGYYRIIDDEGYEMTDYFFGEPRMTPRGIGYWRDGTRPIIAWKRAEQTEPIEECDKADEDCETCWKKLHCRAKDHTEPTCNKLNLQQTCNKLATNLQSTEPSTDCGGGSDEFFNSNQTK